MKLFNSGNSFMYLSQKPEDVKMDMTRLCDDLKPRIIIIFLCFNLWLINFTTGKM